MKTVGWGVIGCSDIVERRAGAAIAGQENSHLVAFHSRTKARAEAFAGRFGADAAYDDLEDLLSDRRIDVVYVATEVDRHADLTIAAVEAGKHVLVEKPMALDAQQCRSMIDAAERNGVRLSVAYYVRFFEKPEVMKELIDQGALGQIVRANVRVMYLYDPAPDNPKYWRVTARGGGNVLADVGSHRLDLLTYFFGRPTRVCGLVDRLSMSYEAADTETGLVQYENGAHVTILANANVGPASGGLAVEIYGTEGALVTDPWSDEPVQVVGSDMQPIAVSSPANAHGPMIDDFARAIVQGRAPRFSGVDGMWATVIIAGVYESARTGKIVSLPS